MAKTSVAKTSVAKTSNFLLTKGSLGRRIWRIRSIQATCHILVLPKRCLASLPNSADSKPVCLRQCNNQGRRINQHQIVRQRPRPRSRPRLRPRQRNRQLLRQRQTWKLQRKQFHQFLISRCPTFQKETYQI